MVAAAQFVFARLAFFVVNIASSTPSYWDITTFTTNFVNLIKDGILAVWGDLIQIILNQANFILILPVMVYLFVVATASLRSFYKG